MGEGVSTLEHLAEMDRLLREVQVELAPEREPAPALEPEPSAAPVASSGATDSPSPPAADATPPAATGDSTPAETETPPPRPDAPDSGASNRDLEALGQLAARLLAAMRELLDGYEQVLVPIHYAPAPTPTATPSAPSALRRPEAEPGVTVTAGPFPSLDAVREFEQAVRGLPGVRDVEVRGYEGANGAIIEVRLDRPGG
jgi:hypothetical protein